MAYPTITERSGILSGIGLAREAVFGTPLLPTDFLPFKSTTLAGDPGLFAVPTIAGVRDEAQFIVFGEQKFNGNIVAPFFPVNGIRLLGYAIGADASGGVATTMTSGSPPATTTAGTNNTAGSTTLNVTLSTGFTAGMEVLVTDATNGNEVLRVTAAGSGTLTVATGLQFSHAAGLNVTVAGNALGAAVSAGSAISAVAVASSANFTIGDVVQIDTGALAECHKVTALATGTFTCGSETFIYAHAANAAVVKVVSTGTAPYAHAITQANVPPSLTIEKNDGGFQSEQYAGCRVDKYSLKVPVGNVDAEFTASVMGRSFAVLTNPSPIAWDINAPFTWEGMTLSVFGGAIAEGANFQVDLSNTLSEKWTYSGAGNNGPGFITANGFGVKGQFDAVFASLNDATRGWSNKLMTQSGGVALGSIVATLAGVNGMSATITLPNVNLSKVGTPLTMKDAIVQTIGFTAWRAPGATTPYTIQVVVQNANYLPY